jgi:hypothetical protein
MTSSTNDNAVPHTPAQNPAASAPIPPWRPYLQTLRLARIGIALAVIVCFLLNVDQALECLVVLAQDITGRSHRILKPILCLVELQCLALMLWYWARALQYKFLDDEGTTRCVRALRAQLPRIIGVVPFIGMLVAIYRAKPDAINVLAGIDIAAAILFYAFCVVRRRVYLKGRGSPDGLPKESKRVLLVTAFFMAVAAAIFTGDPQSAQRVGALTVILSAAAGWVVVCGAITFWGFERSLPLLWIVLVWLLIWSAADTNDNHQIRHLEPTTATPSNRPSPPAMEDSFKQWLANRPDASAYAGKQYPVVLISAEGGGIYAAYHAAMALAELQDTQPAFAQHVFAISGVSGGSVGASAFASLIADRTPVSVVAPAAKLNISGPMATASSAFFDPDFLAPLIAKAFYPDLFQRFNVFPIYAADRTRALEQSVEQAWLKMQKTGGTATAVNRFDASFDALWPDFVHGATPALLLNTTEVETGRQLAVSNLGEAKFGRPHMFFADHPMSYIRLSTAAVLSARFPIVTSAGRESGTSGDRRYVDGGYFENSGMGTLSDVIAALLMFRDSQPKTNPFRLIVVRIALDDGDAAEQDGGPPNPAAAKVDPRLQFAQSAFEEIGSPVRALLNTRSAREESAFARMHAMIDPPQNQCSYFQLLISDKDVPLPLGWLLSERAKDQIKNQIEKPTRRLFDLAKSIEP